MRHPGGRRRVRHVPAPSDLVLEGNRWCAQCALLHAEHPVGAFGGGVQRPAVVQITHDDLCAGLANRIARGLVIPPHRDGGQAQYVSAPVPTDDGGQLAAVLAWARAHLGDRISVDLLAARALMSRRSFTRHFRLATGTSPHAWLRSQRLSLAEELLETSDLSIEQTADRVGYRSAAVLREQFVLRRGVSPGDYRRTFSRS